MISSILASTPSGGIGNRGTLPWPKHSGDLAWFKNHTIDNIVVMGRKTWDDPLMPKPLPNRINYVITNRRLYETGAFILQGDLKERLQAIDKEFPKKEIFVIGGKQIYEATADIVQRVYLTRIQGNYFADTRLDLDRYLRLFQISSVRPGENCTYEVWDRKFF